MAQQSCVFSDETCLETGPAEIHYLLHLPEEPVTVKERRWPMILFLHGRGERGDNLTRLMQHGISKIVEDRPDFPFVTVSPQCPAEAPEWDPCLSLLGRLLEQMMATYPIDPERVYLTGLSMGGRGSWLFATQCPERFAAVVPICARIPDAPGFLARVCVLKDKPVWVFHGGRDLVVSIENSETMVRTLRQCGGSPRFTVYPEASHDSWTAVYDDPELYAWLAEQTLSPPAGVAGQLCDQVVGG